MDQNTGEAPLWVRFYTQAYENERKTRAEGRVIYDQREMVEVRFPGDRHRVLHAPAHQKVKIDGMWVTYAERFPRHYEAFKRHEEMRVVGTPLSEAPFLSVAKRAELERMNIMSVEQLASLDGGALDRLGMGSRALKEQAEAYLQRASETAAEMDKRKLLDRIAELERLVGAEPSERPAPAAPGGGIDVERIKDLSVAELRTVYKQLTGRGPAGQPSHETLVSMVTEAYGAQSEAA